jgi:hypothetical protein
MYESENTEENDYQSYPLLPQPTAYGDVDESDLYNESESDEQEE